MPQIYKKIMPKINRAGQAKVLTKAEMSKLFKAFRHDDHRLIFAICRYTAERVGAVLKLTPLDVYDAKGKIRPILTFRGNTRKGNNHKPGKTRQVPVHPSLAELLASYPVNLKGKFLFPSPRDENKPLTIQSADLALRTACDRAGLGDKGISTHSFRRTAITELAKSGVSVRVIQKITGHAKLEQLSTYIEVSEEEVIAALESL
jgi:integrase/recombinase XerD